MNFRVMRVNHNHADRESWVELMGAKDGEKIEDVDIFKVGIMANIVMNSHVGIPSWTAN
jgi:hypothetical protein